MSPGLGPVKTTPQNTLGSIGVAASVSKDIVSVSWKASKPIPQLAGWLAVVKAGDKILQGGGTYVAQRPAHILRLSTVSGSRALVLVAPDYPAGGFMGGHVIILWNWGGHGYFISLHLDRSRTAAPYTQAERVSAALVIARSAAPSPG
ncbi:MAG: hypothetical protein H0X39_02475 [Actinobacteria bacterium]|nr:hypothetical protein [Actinomycetota bacterium]